VKSDQILTGPKILTGFFFRYVPNLVPKAFLRLFLFKIIKKPKKALGTRLGILQKLQFPVKSFIRKGSTSPYLF